MRFQVEKRMKVFARNNIFKREKDRKSRKICVKTWHKDFSKNL